MSVTVCSGFSPAGGREYGYNFVKTFDKYWPQSVNLAVYTEEHIVIPRGECRSLWDCDGATAFYDRHKDNAERRGVKPILGWSNKDRNKGYSWRFDSLKFFKQCLIPYDVCKRLTIDDIIVWMDADIVTFDSVPEMFVQDLIQGTDLIYLGRGSYHTEIGFWAIRVCKDGIKMLKELADLYTSDRFIELSQHHSAYVFDHVRHRAQSSGLRIRDLTPGRVGHVWMNSPLMKYTDHLKGRRKKIGYSEDHPLKWWEKK